MQFSISRENLLVCLQAVIGVVERRQTLAILANVLISVADNELQLTGTDMEVELSSRMELNNVVQPGQTTVSAKKLLDITRSLPENSELMLKLDAKRLLIQSGRSRFNLAVLSATDFPNSEEINPEASFSLTSQQLKSLVEYTHFCIAQQDVRYYLNGVLMEVDSNRLNVVATDGHRLAISSLEAQFQSTAQQMILPRKGVSELMRLLTNSEEEVKLLFNANQFQCNFGTITFKSRLIDGRFPNYNKVIPKQGNKQLVLDKNQLKQALLRVAVLANEKSRGVRLQFRPHLLQITATNNEQEQAEEEIIINYDDIAIDIGINVNYLMDVVNVLRSPQIKITLTDSSTSLLLQGSDEPHCLYVIMPMRL